MLFIGLSCRVKNLVTWSNLKKTLCMPLRSDFRSDTHEIWTVFAAMKFCTFFKMGHVWSNSQSLGQIIEYAVLVTKGL